MGVSMHHNEKRILLSQSHYTRKILSYHGMLDCKTVSTPLDPGQYAELTKSVLISDEEKVFMQNIPYREAIGQLLYHSTRTRPDIAATVNVLSRHVASPRPMHWTAVKRLLRYLKVLCTTA